MSDVLVITNNLQQASFRLRMEAIRQPLAQRGIHLRIAVRPTHFFSRRRLLRSASRYDAVILQRKLLDPWDVALLAKHARRFFFDVDDAVMYHPKPAGAIQRWRTRRRFVALARQVDRVVAGNEYLAQIFRDQGAPAAVLPTVVDPAHYRVKTHQPTQSPALVWIGSKSTLPYLAHLMPVLAQAPARVPGLRLIVIADQTISPAGLPLEHVPWSPASEAEALCRGDIGIAPMPRDPWTLGKCGFKIVQYMAAGLPVIASPVGAAAELVSPGQTGFLPATADQWIDAMATLAADVAQRSSMGAAGRKQVEEHYCLDRAVQFWAQMLSGS